MTTPTSLPSIKDLVKDNVATFSYYRKGYLYYALAHAPLSPSGAAYAAPITYLFPVPLDDVGDASFNATEKAILLMRCIRKAIDEGSFVKAR